MTDNLRHWSVLSKTDPKHTKEFQRAGGFRGTATKPVYVYEKMTAHFGPCGTGWGMDAPVFQVIEAAGETLVYCTAAVWYLDGEKRSIFGVGGDKVTAKRKDGSVATDDEAFKKAYTDALTNALVKIGVSADVHMGMFEDNKYVSALRKEFAEEGAGASSPPPPATNGHATPKPSTMPPAAPTTMTAAVANGAPTTAPHIVTQAKAIETELKSADSAHKLDLVMDQHRDAMQTLPQVTEGYLRKLYERRRAAMEHVA